MNDAITIQYTSKEGYFTILHETHIHIHAYIHCSKQFGEQMVLSKFRKHLHR